ncbi:MAG: NUDIX hydrolase [Vulcanimicrobiaceae bacterium]
MVVYLTRRSDASRFMPGAYVFPGGAVDAADGTYARAAGLGPLPGGVAPEIGVAAVRELFEEAGVLLARDGAGTPLTVAHDDLAMRRAELARGEPFATILERYAATADVGALAYYSNWITPRDSAIRFDAHFFIASAPPDQIAIADATEVHDGTWIAAAEALARADAGRMQLRYPTRKHLERLARFDDVGALFAHARARTIAPVAPVERDRGALDLADDAW